MNKFVLTVFQEGYLPAKSLMMLKGGDGIVIDPCASEPTSKSCFCNNAMNCTCNTPNAYNCNCNTQGAKYYN